MESRITPTTLRGSDDASTTPADSPGAVAVVRRWARPVGRVLDDARALLTDAVEAVVETVRPPRPVWLLVAVDRR